MIHLVFAFCIYFDTRFLYPLVQAVGILKKQINFSIVVNLMHIFNITFDCSTLDGICAYYINSYVTYSAKFTSSCYLLSIWHKFKMKAKLIEKPLLVNELNKLGLIGLLHFSKCILLSHVTEYPFQNLQYV